MSLTRSNTTHIIRSKSGPTDLYRDDTDTDDFPSDSDSINSHLEMKLSDERRKSRHSEESSPSISLSPNMLPGNMSPGFIPILKQNKSRGERPTDESHYNYTLPALDLAYINYTSTSKKSLNTNNKPIKNTLNLSDEIIDDVYDSLCSWDETEIDSKDKHTMNINQFIKFFNKYIYSTLCIDDENDLETLENNKQIITKAIFENIRFQNSDEIQFPQLLNSVNKLTKRKFIKALNVYHARYPNVINTSPTNQSLLVSICEHTPLTYNENDNNESLDYHSIDINNISNIMDAGDNEYKSQSLLMKDALKLFQRYDSNKLGKLNVSEFKCLLSELYPTFNDDDWRYICAEIQCTNNNKNVIEYKQNISMFNDKIRMLGDEFPEKKQFFDILVEVFSDDSFASILSECKSYDDLNRISENHIDLAMNIRKQYLKNIKHKNKKGHEIEITSTCVEDFWRWIDEYGIQAIRQNEIVQNEHINNDIIEKYNNLCDEYNTIKNKIKIYEESKNSNQLLSQTNKLENIELINENIIQIKEMIPIIENNMNIEKIKSKLLEKDIIINKLENKINISKDNKMVIEYIKNNMIYKRNLKEIRQRNKIYAMLMFLNGIAAGYIVGMKLKNNRKLILYAGAGFTGVSLWGFNQRNQRNYSNWGRMLSVSTGFLIGFAVAFKE